jgi:hypothetical protein
MVSAELLRRRFLLKSELQAALQNMVVNVFKFGW